MFPVVCDLKLLRFFSSTESWAGFARIVNTNHAKSQKWQPYHGLLKYHKGRRHERTYIRSRKTARTTVSMANLACKRHGQHCGMMTQRKRPSAGKHFLLCPLKLWRIDGRSGMVKDADKEVHQTRSVYISTAAGLQLQRRELPAWCTKVGKCIYSLMVPVIVSISILRCVPFKSQSSYVSDTPHTHTRA